MTYFRSTLAGLMYVAVIALGCHSMPSKQTTGANFTANTSWLRDYRKARSLQATDQGKACAIFKELGAETKFPAHQLSLVRAWETCDAEQAPKISRDEFPSWLQDMSLEIALVQAAKSDDKRAEMELASEKSKQRLSQSEKLKWIDLALTRARELNDEKMQAELNKRMMIVAPRLNPAPSERKYLTVASDFRMARQFDKAREFYNRILKRPHFGLDEKVAALKGIRLSYKNARADEAHVEAAKKLVTYLRHAEKLNPKSNAVKQAAYESEVYYGRALWTLHRAAEAKKVFDKIERHMKGHVSVAELYWLKGRMAEESGDLKEVSRLMSAALKEKIKDSDLRDKILWYSAWNERRQKNLPRAAEILTDLAQTTQADFLKVRALFWLGKTYAELKLEDQAKTTLENLIELDPVGYYGLLAHRHLGIAITLKPKNQNTRDLKENDLPLDTMLAEWLILLDEKAALSSLLEQSSKAYVAQKTQSPEGWIALFKYYAKGGLYMKMYEALSSLTPERRKSITESQPDLLFPRPWNEEVRMAALDSGVDEELIYAIIRQESAFDPKARSGADAFGLMQILPEVAAPLAQQKSVPYSHMEDLYDPKINIALGAAHVQDLLKRHKGQFILAVASYNASENAIRNWMKTRYRGDALEFIEEIPYEETRVYVRLVMRNLIFYSLLKSRNASIEFPAWVLKLDPS